MLEMLEFMLEIQDGSQITASSNISETMTYIIKILTANGIRP